LEVFVDPRNKNEWTFCASIPKLNLPYDWLSRSHIGITATTGQLADNHDILYLKSFSDAHVLDQEEQAAREEPHFEVPDELHPQEKFKA
jgi:lectin, mannose-binding 2